MMMDTPEKKHKEPVDKRPWTDEEVKLLITGYEMFSKKYRNQNDVFRAIKEHMGLDRNIKSMQSKTSRLLKAVQDTKDDLDFHIGESSEPDGDKGPPRGFSLAHIAGGPTGKKRKRPRGGKQELPEELMQKLITLREERGDDDEDLVEGSGESDPKKQKRLGRSVHRASLVEWWEQAMHRWEANQQKQELLLDKMMVFFGLAPQEHKEDEEDKPKEHE